MAAFNQPVNAFLSTFKDLLLQTMTLIRLSVKTRIGVLMADFNQPVNVFLSTFQNLLFETKASISIDLIKCILSLG